MVPITGRAGSFLEFKKILFQSKLNPIHFCSFFFLCLQDQSELCGSYHLLQSCFFLFVLLMANLSPSHGQLELFGSCIIFQFCSSFFLCLHGQPEVFVSDQLLQSLFSTTLRFNLLRVARRCFSWSSVSDDYFFSSCNFLVILLVLPFLLLSSAFLSSVL